jgi:uridine phosphorylase
MSIIPESELILNTRGSIYHLDLLPDEIAETIITVGDPRRVPEISKYFERVEVRQQNREFVTCTGYIGKKRLSVISTGIGTDNIDIVMTELDALANIDFTTRLEKKELKKLTLVRIGSSGALQQDIPVDSFVVSEYAIGMDNLMNFYELSHPAMEKEMLIAFLNHEQENHIAFIPYIAGCTSSLKYLLAGDFIKGITITCPGFYGPQGRKLRATLAFPQLIEQLSTFSFDGNRIANFEMETAGIYGMSRLLGHDAISLSTIIVNRIEKKISSDPQKAMDSLIRLTLERLVGE